MADSATPLVVENLRKIYHSRQGEDLVAVDGISFEISPGECLGLLGPNGSGKSTTIECITGFFPPTAGRVLVYGVDVSKDKKKARLPLGVCQQDRSLDTDFSVFDQLVRHARYFNVASDEAEKRADKLLERFGLAEKRKQLVEHLSGGMQRRLQVARALISDPKILILDEPTTGLDPDARRGLWRVLTEERERGLAVLLCTHYMDEAERLCDRIALMHAGKIIDIAPPEQLVKNHMGDQEVTEEVRPGLTWQRPPNLEDVFLKRTGVGLG